jgi:ubiquinone/menaquinone biosynthesis C-methylase UbiE
LNSFNFVAPFYDKLKYLIFKNVLLDSSIFFLDRINQTHNILVIGGGTGEILPSLPQKSKLTYIELSNKMIQYAKEKNTLDDVCFLQMNFSDYTSSNKFDFIICPYFLDVFTKEELNIVVTQITMLLNQKGSLIVSDFDPSKTSLKNRMLMWCMYRFFNTFSKLKPKKYNQLFEKLESTKALSKLDEQSWNKGFIKSQVYELTS